MIVAGADIGRQGPQHVIRCVIAHPFLQDDVGLDLIHGHMPRSFHHHLAPHAAAFFGQLAVDQQFLNHGPVKGVADGAGAQPVSQGQHHIIFFQDPGHPVKFFIERIFFLVVLHPGHHGGAALADQPAVAIALLFQPFDGVKIDPAMNRHEAHAVVALALDQVKQHLFIQLVRVAVFSGGLAESLIERNITHRQRNRRQHLSPDAIQIAADRQFHQGVGPGLLGGNRLFQLRHPHPQYRSRCRWRR